MEESVPVIKDMKETKAAIVSILSPAHKTPTELAMLASVNMDIGDKEGLVWNTRASGNRMADIGE